jgi:hypothetical protein
LIRLSTTDSTTSLKVISLKTRKFWSKLSKEKKQKNWEKKEFKKNNKPEENIMLKREKENSKEDYKNYKRNDNYFLMI